MPAATYSTSANTVEATVALAVPLTGKVQLTFTTNAGNELTLQAIALLVGNGVTDIFGNAPDVGHKRL